MKVEKSTADCTAYNTLNAEAINLGLMDAQEPSDRIVKQEAHAERLRKAEFAEAADAKALLEQLGADTKGEVSGVSLKLEKQGWGSSCTGWRLYIGRRYGSGSDKKWMTVGDGAKLGLTSKQKAKALEKIAEVLSVRNARNSRENEEKARHARARAFIQANPALYKQITGGDYYSEYGSSTFRANVDGTISHNYETFTVDQWKLILDLRTAQKQALQALKDSFKPAAK